MSEQVIKLSDNAASRIKEIMSKAENSTIGVRVGVKSGGCAGMSYVMEYAKDVKPNEEVIEDKLPLQVPTIEKSSTIEISNPEEKKNKLLKKAIQKKKRNIDDDNQQTLF